MVNKEIKRLEGVVKMMQKDVLKLSLELKNGCNDERSQYIKEKIDNLNKDINIFEMEILRLDN